MKQSPRVGHVASSLGTLLALLVPAALGAQFEEPPPPAAYALTNVTLVQADGSRQAGMNVVIRDGLVEAMAPGAEIPADARVLEGDSLYVYPGLVDADGDADLSFPEVDREGVVSWDPPRDVQGFTPHRRAADYLAAAGDDVESARQKGIVAMGVLPSGGLAPGQVAALLLRPDAETPRGLVADPAVALVMSFQGARGAYPGTLFGVIAFHRQMFEDALRQGRILEAYRQDPRGLTLPEWDPDLQVYRDVAGGGLPVFFRADRAEDIRRVLDLADEYGFDPVVVGGGEAWKVADRLRAGDVPVLVSLDFPEPDEWEPADEEEEEEAEEAPAPEMVPREPLEPGAAREKERLENLYANAGRLRDAGVRVALTSGGGEADLLEGAPKAMEYGLSEGDALRALTTEPAAILGIPTVTRLGPRTSATFAVTDGELLAEGTGVVYTFVEGVLEEGRALRGPTEEPTVDVTGRWEMEIQEEGAPTIRVTLTQEGGTFSGTATAAEEGEFGIENGVVSGNEITFDITSPMLPEAIPARGTVEGDRIEGSSPGAEVTGGAFDFVMTRVEGPPGLRWLWSTERVREGGER